MRLKNKTIVICLPLPYIRITYAYIPYIRIYMSEGLPCQEGQPAQGQTPLLLPTPLQFVNADSKGLASGKKTKGRKNSLGQNNRAIV